MLGDVWIAVARPDASVIVDSPYCEVDWYVVDGFEESRDPDGGAVETLITMDCHVAPPKEAQRDKVCGG